MKADLNVIRARAEALRADPDRVDRILKEGATRARARARATMARVREKLGLAPTSAAP